MVCKILALFLHVNNQGCDNVPQITSLYCKKNKVIYLCKE